MAYSDFTMTELKERFQLVVEQVPDLFEAIPEVEPPAGLKTSLRRNLSLAVNIGSEKARSEFLIAPVLLEFKFMYDDRVALFSGLDFNVDEAAGLKGRCDYLLTRDNEQLEITAPVCVLVEAKNEQIGSGIPQCLAEMVAAQRFNAQRERFGPVYGIVSTGEMWKFMKLEGSKASLDREQYPIQMLEKIFGILTAIALN